MAFSSIIISLSFLDFALDWNLSRRNLKKRERGLPVRNGFGFEPLQFYLVVFLFSVEKSCMISLCGSLITIGRLLVLITKKFNFVMLIIILFQGI